MLAMGADALTKRRTSNRAGEVGPEIYAEWRASTLGAITGVLEQQLVLDLAGPLSGKSVLDVGCGDGALAAEFHREGASFVIGCDPDAHMIAKATARTIAERCTMSYLLGRAEHLPFRDQSFDVVTAVTVLCFVEQRARAVEEMARVLRPGGRLVIGGLGRWSTWAASRRVRAWLGNEFWRHARFTTTHELRSAAIAAGLYVDRLCGAVYYPRCDLAARAMKSLDPLLGGVTTFGAAFIAMQATKKA
jgi:SAM-dependent methyltransferase